jgi:hypothetical protein
VWGIFVEGRSWRFLSKDGLKAAMKGIPVVELPKTFRDAITTTINLGIDYIWIDALCVVADDAQDFAKEMARVHEIFSGAYFVIAASRAAAQDDGFLKRHLQRDFVTFLDDSNDPFYVYEAIDDFDQDVLAGPMHQREWTFEERAFARRTIFFGENQMYFECGGGIRCETLSLMHKYDTHLSPFFRTTKQRCTNPRHGYSPIATLLGDPNFPNLAEKDEDLLIRALLGDEAQALAGVVMVTLENDFFSQDQVIGGDDASVAVADDLSKAYSSHRQGSKF